MPIRDCIFPGAINSISPSSHPWAFGKQSGILKTMMAGDSGPSTTQNRNMYDVKMDMSSELFRVFPADWENVERIKHIIIPRLGYSFIPEYKQDIYPYFDQVDRIQEQNLVTFSLTNTFISKLKPPVDMADRNPGAPPPYSYREFLRFLIEQGYDFEQADQEQDPLTTPQTSQIDSKPLMPLYAEIQLEPYRLLAFQADAEWSHYDNDFKSRNFGVMISDIRGDRVFVEYRYEKNDSESDLYQFAGGLERAPEGLYGL